MRTEKPPTLLIVDDIPANVAVLFDFLVSVGFKVLVSREGKQAIQTVNTVHPDLILLDIMMPGMTGFEVCEQLKSQLQTKDIPIIFMTALTDITDKVKGLELGASDYVTKPIQQEEVLARVNTHLKLSQLQKQLQSSVLELEQRTMELEQRNMELDAFARTVAHDLKNPLSGIISLTDLLVTVCSPEEPPSLKSIERLNFVNQTAHKMFGIIEALLLFAGLSQKHSIDIQPIDMKEVVSQVIEKRLAVMVENFQPKIDLPDSWPKACGYQPWIEEIWVNYLCNALKYGGMPPYIQVGADILDDNTIKFWVKDNGIGIPQNVQSQLFTPFTRLRQNNVEGHGLGLSIVRQITEKLGGKVGVESAPGEGSLFFFTLPKSVG